ncbi:MAG TPA: 16S rRNA (uracil(1498)-N(3))-methyltransferase [Clostridia bacterium]|nr:16S rRNA (uracil(1498)-N(3))-methyltransferase [Clostridia bacterium]
MHRFFVEPNQISDKSITITGSDVQHILKVLRLEEGAILNIADGTGMEYKGSIVDKGKDFVRLSVIDRYYNSTESPVEVTLLQGLPKGDKMELIIQKCTELGVKKFVPVACQRSIVKLRPEKAKQKQARWQKISEEAAKQSRRSLIPEITPVQTLEEALKNIKQDEALLIPWEEEKANNLKDALQPLKGKCRKVSILIGPEGGLTCEEVALAKAAGGSIVTLGPRILRTETAGMVVVTMVLYELGDLGGTPCGTR